LPNIEISYLPERMERFKGLAILATNRRRISTRRSPAGCLRWSSLPGAVERERIWRQVFPPRVDVSALDFLASSPRSSSLPAGISFSRVQRLRTPPLRAACRLSMPTNALVAIRHGSTNSIASPRPSNSARH
jgi:hypothetical protein